MDLLSDVREKVAADLHDQELAAKENLLLLSDKAKDLCEDRHDGTRQQYDVQETLVRAHVEMLIALRFLVQYLKIFEGEGGNWNDQAIKLLTPDHLEFHERYIHEAKGDLLSHYPINDALNDEGILRMARERLLFTTVLQSI